MKENIDIDLIKVETLKTIRGLYDYFLIAVSFFIHNLFKKVYENRGRQRTFGICKERKALVMALRILAVLMLLISISVNTVFNINRIRISTVEYNEIKEKAKINAMNTNEALGKVLNAEKLMDMIK